MDTVRVLTPYKAAPAGAVFTVTIVVPEDITPYHVLSMEFILVFDKELLSLRTVAAGNVIPGGHQLEFGIKESKIYVATAGANAFVGKGVLAKMEFRVSSAARDGQTCSLHFERFQFNEPPRTGPVAIVEDGFFSVGRFPDVEISETEHDFGETILGDTSHWTLVVTNIGWADLTVVSMTGSPREFGIASPSFPQIVTPGSSIDVNVFFAPEEMGLQTGELTVQCNAYFVNEVTVSLQGTGIAPDITLSAREYSFGQVAVGNSEDWALRVTNSGNAGLTLSSYVIEPAVFRIVAPVFPQNVAVGEMADIVVRFAPVVEGQMEGVLSLYSNDPDENPASIFLSGLGVPSLGVTDSHTPWNGPTTHDLIQNYPNPFNPSTCICFSVADEPSSPSVNLTVFNLLGQRVRTLVDEPKDAGYHAVTWDGRDDLGRCITAGVYIYRLHIGTYIQTRRMVLTK